MRMLYALAQTMQLEAHQRKSAASGDVPPFDICSGQWEWTPDSKDAYVLHPCRLASRCASEGCAAVCLACLLPARPALPSAQTCDRNLESQCVLSRLFCAADGSKRDLTPSTTTRSQTGPTGFSHLRRSRCSTPACPCSRHMNLHLGTLIPISRARVTLLLPYTLHPLSLYPLVLRVNPASPRRWGHFGAAHAHLCGQR